MSAHLVLANFGCELLGFQAISSAVKKAGHRVSLAFDPGLFDDRVYFRNRHLARFFNVTDKIVDDIVELEPDVVGLYLISDTYRWSRYVARRVKELIDVPILVGGVIPAGSPERIIREDWVDIACIGDGVLPTVRLLDSLAAGKVDTAIENLCFKKRDGSIIMNPRTPPMDLNEEQVYDKALYEGHLPLNYCYMTVASKGCPFRCNYCSQSFLQEQYSPSGHYCEWRDIDHIIDEVKTMKARYGFKEIDFRDNTFITSPKRTREFLNRFMEECGKIPFKVMTFPGSVSGEMAALLKRAGCYKVQFGVQSVSEKTRGEVLNRPGTNEKMLAGFRAMDRAGLKYSIDHIFNLPGEGEKEQREAALTYAQCKELSRITCFWLAYFPGSKIVDIAAELGVLSNEDVERINSLEPDGFYLDSGILKDKKRIRMFNRYHVLFRAMPLLTPFMVKAILNLRLHHLVNLLPKQVCLWSVDILVTLLGDQEGLSYLKSNWWQLRRNFWRALKGNHRVKKEYFDELFTIR